MGRRSVSTQRFDHSPSRSCESGSDFRKRDHERKLILHSMIILCWTSFRGILGRSFLKRLDMVASLVHLKVAYNDAEGRSVSVIADVYKVKRIKGIIQKGSLSINHDLRCRRGIKGSWRIRPRNSWRRSPIGSRWWVWFHPAWGRPDQVS